MVGVLIGLGIVSVQERSPEAVGFSYDTNSNKYTVRIEKILEHAKHKKCYASILNYQNSNFIFVRGKGKILLYFESATEDTTIQVGQEYLVHSKMSKLKTNTNPHAFDYASYLNKQGIYHQIFVKPEQYSYLRTKYKNWIVRSVHRIQESAKETLQKYFKDQESLALVNAMVLGNRALLSEDQSKSFINTGAIHVLAVSGLHVGIVCLFLSFFLGLFDHIYRMPKTIKGVVIIICIWFFALVTGASSAVCRAALMFSLFFVAKDILHRHVSSYNIVFGSALLILIHDPQQLFSISFQFSYLAVISIIFFFPYVDKFFDSKIKLINHLWSSVALGIAAQILVFPLSIYYFNQFANSFILSSLFVVQVAMIILVSCLLILLFELVGLVWVNQVVIAPIINKLINYFQIAINKIQDLPFSHVGNLWLDKVQLILIYLFLIFLMVFIKKKNIKILALSLSIVIFYFAYTKILNQQKSTNHCLYIYDSKDVFIDIFIGSKCYYIGQESDEAEAFVYGRNRMANHIRSSQPISALHSHNALEFKNNILRVGNTIIAFANENTFTEVKSATTIDYIFINKNILNEMNPNNLINTNIVISSGLPSWMRNEIVAYCEKYNLTYQNIGVTRIEF